MFLVKNSPRGGDNGTIGFPYAKVKGPCGFSELARKARLNKLPV